MFVILHEMNLIPYKLYIHFHVDLYRNKWVAETTLGRVGHQ